MALGLKEALPELEAWCQFSPGSPRVPEGPSRVFARPDLNAGPAPPPTRKRIQALCSNGQTQESEKKLDPKDPNKA